MIFCFIIFNKRKLLSLHLRNKRDKYKMFYFIFINWNEIAKWRGKNAREYPFTHHLWIWARLRILKSTFVSKLFKMLFILSKRIRYNEGAAFLSVSICKTSFWAKLFQKHTIVLKSQANSLSETVTFQCNKTSINCLFRQI